MTSEAAKTAPSAAVTVGLLLGLSLDAWVAVSAIGYALLQSAFLIWKWRREYRREARHDD